MKIREAYTFDDILLIPASSSIMPAEVDISSYVTSQLKVSTPIISAAMDRVTEAKMAIAMALNGGIGAIHKNMTIDLQAENVRSVKNYQGKIFTNSSCDSSGRLLCMAAIGTGEAGILRAEALIKAGVDVVIIDTAHGHSKAVIDTVATLRKLDSKIQIIGGNIATAAAAKALIEAGANGVKVGIGPGSICTTRIITGVGMPQFTAIYDVADYCKSHNITVIADGGIRYSGDVAKAIAAGADMVMIGSLLAACEESPGEVINIDGKSYKEYRGMGSLGAMKDGSADRYFQEGQNNKKLVPEGIEGRVAFKGPISETITQLIGGLRSAMGYTGNGNISQMKTNCNFVKITNAAVAEGHPHGIEITKKAPNY